MKKNFYPLNLNFYHLKPQQTFGDGQQSNKGEINIPGELDPTSTTEDGSSFRHVFLIYKSDAYDCPIQPDEYPYTFSMTDNLYSEVRAEFKAYFYLSRALSRVVKWSLIIIV